MPRPVLWDIDQTLVESHGVGRELSARAFEHKTGGPMQYQARFDGITETVIFRETTALPGHERTPPRRPPDHPRSRGEHALERAPALVGRFVTPAAGR